MLELNRLYVSQGKTHIGVIAVDPAAVVAVGEAEGENFKEAVTILYLEGGSVIWVRESYATVMGLLEALLGGDEDGEEDDDGA